MPEGPELHLSSQFINTVCKGRIFSGKVRRNPIHKCADVAWDAAAYTISSVSRGKELKVFLQSLKTEIDETAEVDNKTIEKKHESPSTLHILFNFGMSGKFEFTPASEMPKHAHLSFFTQSEPSMALSFVDYRRFGKWQVGADWTSDRGPCVLFEYPQFRSNVMNNLSDSAFNKPVCEVLLNQKYFNGIGNYLRAEICFRGGVRPFDQARAVFSALPDAPEDHQEVKVKVEDGVKSVKVKEGAKAKTTSEKTDVLELCNIIPLEVVGLGTSLYLPEDEDSDMSRFSMWLQCYYKPGMKNVADHNKRTMWFTGDPGPLLPKEGGSRKRHGVYDKKLTKGAKKMKKEAGDVTAEENGDTSNRKAGRSQKSKTQNKQMSPVKSKRITRKSLKTLIDESAKPPKSSLKSKKVEDKKSSKRNADGNSKSIPKSTTNYHRKTDCENNQTVSQLNKPNTKHRGKRRATRANVK